MSPLRLLYCLGLLGSSGTDFCCCTGPPVVWRTRRSMEGLMRRSWRFRVETGAFGLIFTRSIWLVQGFSSMREPIGSTVIDCSLFAADGAAADRRFAIGA